MGCGTSSAFIQCYDDLRRSPKFVKWNEMFAALGLRAEEIKALFKVFWNADMDGGGTIDVVELLTVVDVERTPFTERIFSIFDEDRSGKIDFGEFVLALWNYCTLSNYTLAIFAFELYDRDFTGVLERQDLELMLTDIYGKEWKKNHYAKQVLKNLDDWHGGSDGSVVIGSFIEFTTSHQHLLFPAFQMQLCLRNKSIGSSFWDQQRQRRLKMCDNKYLKLEDYLTMVSKKDFRGADGWLPLKSKTKYDQTSSRRTTITTKSGYDMDDVSEGSEGNNVETIPKRRGSKTYVQDRRPSKDFGVSSPRSSSAFSPRPAPQQPRTRHLFVSPRNGDKNTPVLSELDEFLTQYHGTMSGGNSRRKSINGSSPFKIGAVVPQELLAMKKDHHTPFETNAGPLHKNKNRRGSV